MKTNKPFTPLISPRLITSSVSKDSSIYKKGRTTKDIVPNVNFKDALIRFGITLALPILVLFIDKHWVVYTVPVAVYLFITVLARFCVVKYLWHRYARHEPAPVLPAYGEDPNYPEESI